MYETRVHHINELRQRLLHAWYGLEQSLIDDAVDQWSTRLRACVRANGGHFEDTLCLSVSFFVGLLDEFYVSHHRSYPKGEMWLFHFTRQRKYII